MPGLRSMWQTLVAAASTFALFVAANSGFVEFRGDVVVGTILPTVIPLLIFLCDLGNVSNVRSVKRILGATMLNHGTIAIITLIPIYIRFPASTLTSDELHNLKTARGYESIESEENELKQLCPLELYPAASHAPQPKINNSNAISKDANATNTIASSKGTNAINTDVNAINTNVDAISKDANASTTNAISKDANAISTDVDAISQDANASNTNAISKDVNAINTDVDAISKDANASNTNAISKNANAISKDENASNTNAISKYVNAINTDVKEICTNVDAINTDVNSISKDENAINTDVNAIDTDVDAINTDVNAINTEASNTDQLMVLRLPAKRNKEKEVLLRLGLAPTYKELSFLRSRNRFQTIVTCFQAAGYLLTVLDRVLENLGISPVEAFVTFLCITVCVQLLMELYACSKYQRPLLLRLNAHQLRTLYTAMPRDDLNDEIAMNVRDLWFCCLMFIYGTGELGLSMYYFVHYVHSHFICALAALLFFLAHVLPLIFLPCVKLGSSGSYILAVLYLFMYVSSMILALVSTIVEWEAFHEANQKSWYAWILPHVSS